MFSTKKKRCFNCQFILYYAFFWNRIERRSINALKFNNNNALNINNNNVLNINKLILTKIITTKHCLNWSLIIVFSIKVVIDENITTTNFIVKLITDNNKTIKNFFEETIIDENKTTKNFFKKTIIDKSKATKVFFKRFDFRFLNFVIILLCSTFVKRFNNVIVF